MIESIKYGLRLVQMVKDNRARRGPLRVDIAVTSACNYNCLFCNWHSPLIENTSTPDKLDRTVLCDLFRGLAKLGTKYLLFSGNGEPLLYRDLLSQIPVESFDIEIVTNGSLLEKIGALAFAKLKRVTVSLNSGTGASHPKTHGYAGTNRFDHTLWHIRRLAAIDPDKVRLNYVVTVDNYTEIPYFISKCEALGVKYALRHVSVDRPEFQQLSIAPSLSTHDDKLRPCYNGYIQPYVAANGNVLVCPGSGNIPMGNLNRDTFEQIWQAPSSIELRRNASRMHKTGQALCISCRGCPLPKLHSAQFHKFFRWIA